MHTAFNILCENIFCKRFDVQLALKIDIDYYVDASAGWIVGVGRVLWQNQAVKESH